MKYALSSRANGSNLGWRRIHPLRDAPRSDGRMITWSNKKFATFRRILSLLVPILYPVYPPPAYRWSTSSDESGGIFYLTSGNSLRLSCRIFGAQRAAGILDAIHLVD